MDCPFAISIYCPLSAALTREKLLLRMLKLLRYTYNKKNYPGIIYQIKIDKLQRNFIHYQVKRNPGFGKVSSSNHYKYILMFLLLWVHSDAYIYLLLYEHKIKRDFFKQRSAIGKKCKCHKIYIK